MKKSLSVMGLVLGVAVACVACDKIKPPMPELQKNPATSGQAGSQEGERTAFALAAQKELDDLKLTIAEFKAKAEASSAETKAKLGEEVKKLEVDMDDAQERLTELKTATVDSWGQVKASFSSSFERLKSRVESFRKNAG
ncbi:hypothetical protein BH10PSE16_BH10PSE16_26510 [soil metagenome]